jgi:hypothetical protein
LRSYSPRGSFPWGGFPQVFNPRALIPQDSWILWIWNHTYTLKFGAIDVFQTNPFVYGRWSRVPLGFAEPPLGAISCPGIGERKPQGIGSRRGVKAIRECKPEGIGFHRAVEHVGIGTRRGFVGAGDSLAQGIRWRRGFVGAGDSRLDKVCIIGRTFAAHCGGFNTIRSYIDASC